MLEPSAGAKGWACYLDAMNYTPLDLRHAWLVLRATRLRLAALTPQASGSATGFIPAVACEQLVTQGWDARRAEGAVRQALLGRFTAFADSWDDYIDNRGWLLELLGAPEGLREKTSGRFSLAPLLATVETLRVDPQAPLKDARQWGPLLKSAGELSQQREAGQHPAAELMVSKYGLHRELAKAVLLHSRLEPWWAHIALAAAWLVCGLVFLAALVNPHNPAFENDSVGGVGPLHYVVLPLFALMFLAAQIWLIKVRPQRQKQWREQLGRYIQASGAGDSGWDGGAARS